MNSSPRGSGVREGTAFFLSLEAEAEKEKKKKKDDHNLMDRVLFFPNKAKTYHNIIRYSLQDGVLTFLTKNLTISQTSF